MREERDGSTMTTPWTTKEKLWFCILLTQALIMLLGIIYHGFAGTLISGIICTTMWALFFGGLILRDWFCGTIDEIDPTTNTCRETSVSSIPTDDELGEQAWVTYCELVGGTAHDGASLPTWEELKRKPDKAHIVEAWIGTGKKLFHWGTTI